MKSFLIVAVAVATLGGFVWISTAAKHRAAQAWSDSFMAGVYRNERELRCREMSAANPSDAELQALCGREERLINR